MSVFNYTLLIMNYQLTENQFRALDQQQREPYQPHCLCTC